MAMDLKNKAALFFDGECTLCSWGIDALLRADQKRRLMFSTLQNPAGLKVLKDFIMSGHPEMTIDERQEVTEILFPEVSLSDGVPNILESNLRSVIVINEDRIYFRADAIIFIIQFLGFPWSLGSVLRLLPKMMRNSLYNWVARNRFRWFGKKVCRIPTPDEQSRFI